VDSFSSVSHHSQDDDSSHHGEEACDNEDHERHPHHHLRLKKKNSIDAESLKRKKHLLKTDSNNDQSMQKFQKHLSKLNVFTDLYQSTQDKMITQNIRKSMHERRKERQSILKVQTKEDQTLFQKLLNFRFTPNKGFKLRWDLIIIFLSIYNSLMIPLQFALPSTIDRIIMITVIDYIVDVLFAIDIIIMFRTSY